MLQPLIVPIVHPLPHFVVLPAGGRLLHHLGLLFLKPLSNPLTARHEFLDTACDTASFSRYEGFGCEVVNTGIKAVRYEVREHLA